MSTTAPKTTEELMSRVFDMAGQTLGTLAKSLNMPVPTSRVHAKGWAGQLIEMALGADAKNLDEPDFMQLHIELKTLPISLTGRVAESTYLCKASIPFTETRFEDSRAWRKLSRILWVPIEDAPNQSLESCQIGVGCLWSPDTAIAAQLKKDWYDISEFLKYGRFDEVKAHYGHFMQLRPKGPNSKTHIRAQNEVGDIVKVIPCGFYLRSSLTQAIVLKQYAR